MNQIKNIILYITIRNCNWTIILYPECSTSFSLSLLEMPVFYDRHAVWPVGRPVWCDHLLCPLRVSPRHQSIAGVQSSLDPLPSAHLRVWHPECGLNWAITNREAMSWPLHTWPCIWPHGRYYLNQLCLWPAVESWRIDTFKPSPYPWKPWSVYFGGGHQYRLL